MSSNKSADNKDENNDKQHIYAEVRKCNRMLDFWILTHTPPFPYCYNNKLPNHAYALNQYNICLNNISGYGKD